MGTKRQAPRREEVVFYTYPKLLFTWLLIMAGFALGLLADVGWGEPTVLGWIYAIILVITVLTISIDINRNTAVFWVVSIAFCWVAVLWLRDVQHLTVFSHIYRFFADLDVAYPADFGFLVSAVLSVPYAIMLVWTRLNSKWRVTHEEFEHYSFGRADDSLARGAKRVRTSYPDLCEFFLCLAGDLIIYDSTGERILRVIPHVPLLPLKRRRLNRIFAAPQFMDSQMAVATADDEEQEERRLRGRYYEPHSDAGDDRMDAARTAEGE